MKIVFIISGLNTGGAEIMLLRLLARIDRSRFSPHVISLATLGEIGPHIQALDIPVETLGMRARRPNLLAFFQLVRRLNVLKPDIVQTWMYHADLAGGLAARITGVSAAVWGIHHSNLDRDKNKLATRMVVYVCAWLSRWLPNRVLICSETARQVHVDMGYVEDKMAVVPNGFDLATFRPDPAARLAVRAELGVEPGTPLVGLVGRLNPQKNHAGFFEAAGHLRGHLPKVQFVLVGKGVDEGNHELVRIAETAGVRSVTHFLGLRRDIPCLMASLDVLVSSSYGEAFPNVLGEAMACGVPCVVTDVGDSAYIVGETGCVVPPGDMAGLARAIEKLLVLPAEQRQMLGQRARARVAEHFEIGQVVQRYEAFYEELAKTRQEGSKCAD